MGKTLDSFPSKIKNKQKDVCPQYFYSNIVLGGISRGKKTRKLMKGIKMGKAEANYLYLQMIYHL